MSKLKAFITKELTDYKILLRNIPSPTILFFTLSVVCANLMANKEFINFKYLALDCGFVFSWIMFLCMDVICKRWGAKASVKISVFAFLINLTDISITLNQFYNIKIFGAVEVRLFAF